MALTDNILAYWNLNDDGSGGVSLVDSTGNGNTLTNNNGVSLGTGIINGDGVFDWNVPQWLQTTNGGPSSPISTFSVSQWVNFYDLVRGGVDERIFAQRDGNNNEFILSQNDGVFRIYCVGTIIYGSTSLSTNTWYHVCATYDGNTLSLYVNGNLDASTSKSGLFMPSADWWLGAESLAGGNPNSLNGQLDEVGIWNRALSSDEITKLYNNGGGLTYPFIVLYYNAAVNNDWGTLGNWWSDAAFTFPATALPDNTTPVEIHADVISNTAGDGVCYCASAEFHSASFYSPLVLNSASGVVNISGTAGVFDGTASGNISIHDTCSLGNNAVITGDATFRDSSTNSYGTIHGNAYFYESSYNYGQIDGNATVYYSNGSGSYPIGGTVTGTVSYLGWPAVQDQYFNDQATGSGATGNWQDKNNWWAEDSFTTRPLNSVGTQELPDAGSNIYVYGNGLQTFTNSNTINVNRARFYNSAYLNAPITLNVSINVYFYGYSGNQSIIYGDCYFYNNTYFHSNYGTGYIHGNVYFYDNSGVYLNSGSDYQLATGGLYMNSLQALKNSFSYKFGGLSDGVVYNLPSGGGGFISRLLNLPWFIKL